MFKIKNNLIIIKKTKLSKLNITIPLSDNKNKQNKQNKTGKKDNYNDDKYKSLGIRNININNLDTLNNDILNILKNIYIDLYNFIIKIDYYKSSSKEFKDELLNYILQNIKL